MAFALFRWSYRNRRSLQGSREYRNSRTTAVSHPAGYRTVPDVFAQADFKSLSDSDLDSYIASSVTEADRAIARKIMKSMLPNRRGNIVYGSLSGHLVSKTIPCYSNWLAYSLNLDLASSRLQEALPAQGESNSTLSSNGYLWPANLTPTFYRLVKK